MNAILLILLQTRVLTLDDAVKTATQKQPQMRQAQANTDAARARADEARSGLLPQVNATAQYQRTTSNLAPQPGINTTGTSMGPMRTATWDTFNFWSLGANATQLLWDFNQTADRWRAAKSTADAQFDSEQYTTTQVVLNVRTAYFNARAQKALVQVARETLTNQDKHLQQIQGFVQVGTRPEIDLAQAKTDRANAQVQVITADNGYETAKAQLNQAMGVEGPTDYDVADEQLGPVEGEDQPIGPLVDEAVKARPDLVALEKQIRAQELTVSSVRGAYLPTFTVGTAFTDRSAELSTLDNGWNWNASVALSWPIFQGLLTKSQVRENEALLTSLEAQRDLARQQVRLEVDQARLAVRAAKAAVLAAAEALANAQVRLRLAEGRYQTGVGSVIELGDAQVALTQAAAQKVQADYNVSTARAQLLKALGRR
jgi:outer membrane protein